MSDESGRSFFSTIPLPGLVAVITGVLSTLLVQYEPLTPRRPSESNNSTPQATEFHQIEATPYEDPLAIIRRANLIHPDKISTLPNLDKPHHLVHRPSAAIGETRGPLLVLPVFLKPGLDRVNSESRARTRLAIIEGLASSGYISTSGRIECCRFTNSDLGIPPSPIPNDLDLPFERFSKSKEMHHLGNIDTSAESPSQATESKETISPHAEYENVIILWISGNDQDTQPIAKLRRILHHMLGVSTPSNSGYGSSPVQVIALGPHNTASLVQMAKEADQWSGISTDQWNHPIWMISYAATAPASFVLTEAEIGIASGTDPLASRTSEERLKSILSSSLGGNFFHRTIKTDDVIAEALLNELESRGIKVRAVPPPNLSSGERDEDDSQSGSLSRIAIISEFDSPYGRAFPSIFLAAAKEQGRTFSGIPSRWHWFNFSLGLDGRTTTGTSVGSEEGGSKEKGDTAKDRTPSPGEIPDGPNQADALRRMAQDLQKLDQRLIQEGNKGIEAIGLMGGDVFDKLWLMRALKPHFPRAVFFTDNLNAWLWQKDELRTTRNLIVASPFGLSLADEWQTGKPPFRESYQTSAYASTLAATRRLPVGQLTSPSVRDVRLYEIGSKGPHDLAPEKKKGAPRNIHPDPELRPSPGRFYGILAIIVGISVIALIYWSMPQIARALKWLRKYGISAFKNAFKGNVQPKELADFHRGLRSSWIYYITHPFVWIIPITAVSILSTYLLWRIANNDEGEPFHLLSGISAWPSQGFRIAAILLTVHLTGHLLRTLKDNAKHLERTFFKQQGRIPRRSNSLTCLFNFLRHPRKKTANPSEASSQNPLNWFSKAWRWPSEKRDIVDIKVDSANPWTNLKVDPAALWLNYRQHTGNRVRCIRALFIFLVLLAFYCFLKMLLRSDVAPIRGSNAIAINTFLSWTSTSAFLWLTAIVIDAMWTARMFASLMTTKPTRWDSAKIRYPDLKAPVACDYMDLEVIAERTRPIVSFAFYPFYVLVLLIIARGECFDHWIWPKSLITIYVIAIALVLAAAKLMRTGAENIRETLLRSLKNGGIDAANTLPPQDPDKLLEKYVSRVEQMKTGALAPISQQPIMKGVYWLLSGLGIGSLWQHFSQVL